jgi:plastocyanin
VTVLAGLTVFHIIGGLFAVWALTVAFLGITRREFPGKDGQERTVGAISVLFALAAISSAIIVGALEDKNEGGESHAAPAAEKPVAGGQRLSLRADPSGNLAFDKKALEANAGPVTIAMENPAVLQHDVSLEGSGVKKVGKVVAKGGTSTVSADLKPGKYTFYCSVPGHRQGGMQGTLTVK